MARLVNQKCLQSGLVPMISVGRARVHSIEKMWVSQPSLWFTPITFVFGCSQPSHRHSGTSTNHYTEETACSCSITQ